MSDMHSFQFSALYTLQHCLAGYAEELCGFNHRNIALRRRLYEVSLDGIIHADTPGSAGSNLFAGDETFLDPAMDGGGDNAEDICGLFDRNGFTFGWRLGSSEAWDLPVLLCRRLATRVAVKGSP